MLRNLYVSDFDIQTSYLTLEQMKLLFETSHMRNDHVQYTFLAMIAYRGDKEYILKYINMLDHNEFLLEQLIPIWRLIYLDESVDFMENRFIPLNDRLDSEYYRYVKNSNVIPRYCQPPALYLMYHN